MSSSSIGTLRDEMQSILQSNQGGRYPPASVVMESYPKPLVKTSSRRSVWPMLLAAMVLVAVVYACHEQNKTKGVTSAIHIGDKDVSDDENHDPLFQPFDF